MDSRERAMRRAAELGIEFANGLAERHVGAQTDAATLAARLGGPLPDDGEDAETVVEQMARDFDPVWSRRRDRGTSGSWLAGRFRPRRAPTG